MAALLLLVRAAAVLMPVPVADDVDDGGDFELRWELDERHGAQRPDHGFRDEREICELHPRPFVFDPGRVPRPGDAVEQRLKTDGRWLHGLARGGRRLRDRGGDGKGREEEPGEAGAQHGPAILSL